MFSPLSKQAHRPLDTHLTGAWVVGREAARRLSAAQQAGSIIYRVDAQGLTAVLDSEFAGWGDRLEDIGWFCARCWRFAQLANAAGGNWLARGAIPGLRARVR